MLTLYIALENNLHPLSNGEARLKLSPPHNFPIYSQGADVSSLTRVNHFKRLDLWQRNTYNSPNERQLGSIAAYKFGNQWCLNCLLTKISETTALISKHSSWAKNTELSRDTSKGNSLYRMVCCQQYVMNANKWFMQMWRDDQIARGAAVIIFQRNIAAWFYRTESNLWSRG